MVMLIVSVALVAFLRYQKRQAEVAAAQLYGQNLYTFGQAVRGYVFNSPQLFPNKCLPDPTGAGCNALVTKQVAGNVVKLTATGVLWVQPANAGVNAITQQPYLVKGFTFNTGMPPLMLATPDAQGLATATTGDSTITTIVTFDTTTPNVPPSISITGGVLYEQPTATGKTPVIKPDLTMNAIQAANSMSTPGQGPSSFIFTVPYINAQGAYTAGAKTTASLNPTATQDAYLKVDGTNNMMGVINFAAPNSTNNKINNLATLTFDGTSASTLSGLQTMSFNGVNSAAISALNNLNFNSTNSSMMDGLHTLNFYPGAAVIGPNSSSINNLNVLAFAGTGATGGVINGLSYSPTFKGLTVQGPFFNEGCAGAPFAMNCTSTTALDTGVSVYDSNGKHRSICFLAQTVEPYRKSQWGKWGCKVDRGLNIIQGTIHWYVTNEYSYDSMCQAYCLVWN
jgi:hypothetical protein